MNQFNNDVEDKENKVDKWGGLFLGLLLWIIAGAIYWFGQTMDPNPFTRLNILTLLCFIFGSFFIFKKFHWAAVLVALLATLYYISTLFIQFSSASWPTADGTVISSSYSYDPPSGYIYKLPGGWDLKVKYKYEVNGIDYSYDYDSFMETAGIVSTMRYGSEQEAAQMIQTKFYPGATIPVYYSPNNPSQSVLVPRVFSISKRDLFVIILIAGFILYRIFIVLRKKNQNKIFN